MVSGGFIWWFRDLFVPLQEIYVIMRIPTRLISNVKHRFRGTDFLKEMVLTIIATTISIALTFGTAHLIENYKNKQDGRKIVMMVIHDMDQFVSAFHEQAKYEEKSSNIAIYVMNHLDSLESLPEDTLTSALEYLIQVDDIKYDESSEKIFQSSQDSWKNINSTTVVDLIQDFFSNRRTTIDHINTNHEFFKPISKADDYEILLNSPDHYYDMDLVIDVLRKVMKENKTQHYLIYAAYRQDYFNTIANEWQRASDQCKFVMNISDEEMEAYLKEASRTGSRLTKNKLVGKWIVTSTDETDKETIEFNKDNTFVHIKYHIYTSTLFTGHITTTHTMPGRWELKGDSLIREYSPGGHIEMDRSNVSYTPEMKDTVEFTLDKFQKSIDKRNEELKKDPSLDRRANVAFIDKSGNKIELQSYTTDADGEEEDITYYITREK